MVGSQGVTWNFAEVETTRKPYKVEELPIQTTYQTQTGPAVAAQRVAAYLMLVRYALGAEELCWHAQGLSV
jgi:hypothetical protein